MKYLVILLLAFSQANASTITNKITSAALSQGIDPNLALAVAEVESGLKPDATGKAGEIGLFQLHPRFHPTASYKVKENIDLGIKTLLFWQHNCPTKTNFTFVNCYNRGYKSAPFPRRTPYYKKVMIAYKKRQQSPSLRVGVR